MFCSNLPTSNARNVWLTVNDLDTGNLLAYELVFSQLCHNELLLPSLSSPLHRRT